MIANATGRDHPRGAGLVRHLGVALDLPSVGLTDRPLLAAGAQPGPELWAMSPLLIERTTRRRSISSWWRAAPSSSSPPPVAAAPASTVKL